MARSRTRRKSRNRHKISSDDVKALERNINHVVEYVNTWQKNELLKLTTENSTKVPVCVRLSNNSYLVGQHAVKYQNNLWKVYDIPCEREYEFGRRASAFIYSLSVQIGRRELAQAILSEEQSVLLYEDQVQRFQYSKNRALNRKDYWNYDYFNSLYTNSQCKLEAAKKRLEKSFNLAKYFKIWKETP